MSSEQNQHESDQGQNKVESEPTQKIDTLDAALNIDPLLGLRRAAVVKAIAKMIAREIIIGAKPLP
jgi:hypothetical protein